MSSKFSEAALWNVGIHFGVLSRKSLTTGSKSWSDSFLSIEMQDERLLEEHLGIKSLQYPVTGSEVVFLKKS